MYVLKITNDYVREANNTQSVHKDFSNRTNNEKEDISIFIKYLLLSTSGSVLLLSFL